MLLIQFGDQLDLLLDLQQSFNLAYLFISHDMAVVERVSHRVAVMYLGEKLTVNHLIGFALIAGGAFFMTGEAVGGS